MITYTPEQLAEIIRKHTAWLHGEEGGECANLTDADLTRANLTDADLYGARSYNGTVGNMRNVKSVQAAYWPVTYTATHMQIGCQLHTLAEWWAFGACEIARMDSHATAWWAVWKSILQAIVTASPAKPTGYEPQEAAQ